jgi:hyperosmotically inducible protein
MRFINPMQNTRPTSFLIGILLLGSAVGQALQAQPQAPPKPDNSAVNKQDQGSNGVTADQQKINPADRALTDKVRRAVIADKSLSTYAHNVKIISQDGTVTLKGPVRSDQERQSIVAKAVQVTGSEQKVVNQMTVAPSSKP